MDHPNLTVSKLIGIFIGTKWVYLWFQVEVPEDEDSYPEPVPPANSRSDVFNPREYIQVDQHALKVSLQDFPNGILAQVWCLIVSIPDLCPLSYSRV